MYIANKLESVLMTHGNKDFILLPIIVIIQL